MQSRGDLKNSRLHTDALAYFQSAQKLLTNAEPLLIAVGGFSGTGKSLLAAALAPSIGSAPGALHIQSDIERKVLFGVGETVRLPDSAYKPEISAQVYERMRCHSEVGLKAGRSIIVDATFTKVDGRKVLANLALDLGVRFMGFWLEAPPDVLRQRIFERRGDASDATAEILADQIREDLGEMTWKKLDASKSLDTLKADALAALA